MNLIDSYLKMIVLIQEHMPNTKLTFFDMIYTAMNLLLQADLVDAWNEG